MKNRVVVGIVMVLAAGSSISVGSGQALKTLEELQRPSLRDLNGVEVLVSISLPEGEALDLTRSQLQSEVEVKLRTAGVRTLSSESSFDTPGSPFLYVKLSAFKADPSGYVCRIDVDLNQDVILERDPAIRTVATTWQTGWVGLFPQLKMSALREPINSRLERFISDYLALNP